MLKKIVLKNHEGNKIVPTRVELANRLNEVIEVVNTVALQKCPFEEDCLDNFAKDLKNNIGMDGKDEIIDIEDGPFLVIDHTKVVGDGNDAEICALLFSACADMIRDGLITKDHLRIGLQMIIDKVINNEE